MITFLKQFFSKKRSKRKSVEIVDLIKYKPSYRRTGETTRIADQVIQEFFNSELNERITYRDHYWGSLTTCHLRGIIEKRLESEHGMKRGKHFLSYFDRHSNVLVRKV